eukprot:6189260-Pleurochrysis_carterae.AAC.5
MHRIYMLAFLIDCDTCSFSERGASNRTEMTRVKCSCASLLVRLKPVTATLRATLACECERDHRAGHKQTPEEFAMAVGTMAATSQQASMHQHTQPEAAGSPQRDEKVSGYAKQTKRRSCYQCLGEFERKRRISHAFSRWGEASEGVFGRPASILWA